MNKINLKEYLSEVHDYFSPKVVEGVNDVYIKVAKIKGDKVPWHNHENDDELFYVIEGKLLIEIENQNEIMLNKGDLYVVKRGVEHRVSSTEECHIMLIENKSTEHTGKVQSEITKTVEEQL
ncbi:MAG: 3-hydroxyanthranilate 3,4-dioxygenase [Candidatus Heimdallarchaeota archaeon LC_2]|nr:MAG: 3-hydroxyanthranilate 3,4-dioxygenase [Candidatus Heimdallarchaeota archaeon LC_2]